jgi:hypothetical protein
VSVTTNNDKLLERSFASVSNWPRTPTHLNIDILGSLLFDGSFFILKVHERYRLAVEHGAHHA